MAAQSPVFEAIIHEAAHQTRRIRQRNEALPDIAGRQIANPTALLLSAVLMLRHIDEGAAADRIMTALGRVLSARAVRTRDLGGPSSTMEFAETVCRAMDATA